MDCFTQDALCPFFDAIPRFKEEFERMAKYSPQDILRMVEENQVRFIRLQFTDIFGAMKCVNVTASQLQKVLRNECKFDGSSIEGFTRIEESDMCLYPDPDSFRILPWSDQGRVARLICDVHTTDGAPFAGCPRYVLRRVLAHARAMGFDFYVGPELEFFLFHTDEAGKATTRSFDEGGYFDISPVDPGEKARREMCILLEEMGFEIEASHHEVARGQHEIDFKYDEALTTADNVITFKEVVKTTAQRHGLHATFMPKPIFGIAGSGMHINMSLFRDGKNVFYDETDRYGLSETAYRFIAGVMRHAASLAAVTNPLVNSYKRLVPGYEAPLYIAWSARNRSPLIRIPDAKGQATRIELRNPDPTANPYLVFALVLEAGLEGIEQGLVPPEAVNQNIYNMTREERKAAAVTALPADLNAAIERMEEDPLVRNVLGSHIYEKYLAAKRTEWREYRMRVSQWELDEYLGKY